MSDLWDSVKLAGEDDKSGSNSGGERLTPITIGKKVSLNEPSEEDWKELERGIEPIPIDSELKKQLEQRAVLAENGSKITGINKSRIFDNPDEFGAVMMDIPIDDVKKDFKFWDNAGQYFDQALKGIDLYTRIGKDGLTPELVEEEELYSKRLIDVSDANWFERIGLSIIDNAPVWIGMAAKGGAYGATLGTGFATVAGGVTASTGVGLPAVPITGAVAGAMGYAAGQAYGGWDYYRTQARGRNYVALRKETDKNGNKMDPHLAWTLADTMASLEGAIEGLQLKTLVKGGLLAKHVLNMSKEAAEKKVKSKARQVAAKIIHSKAMNSVVAKTIVRTGGATLEETGEEVVQEVSNIGGEELARYISNITAGTEFEHATLSEDANRLVETFKQSLGTMGALSLLRVPATIKQESQNIRQEKINQRNKTLDEASDEEMNALEGKIAEVAEKDVPESKTEEFKRKSQTAFNLDDEKIDVGMEVVEKLAKAKGMTTDDFIENYIADVVGDEDLSAEELLLQSELYHGSPHSFDKFSTDHIGSGEGNQSFGWGLYFTEEEAIGKGYAENLFDKEKVRNINKELSSIAKELKRYETGGYGKYNDPKGYELKEEYNQLMAEKLENDNVLYKVSPSQAQDFDNMAWVDWDEPIDSNDLNKINNQGQKEGIPLKETKYAEEKGRTLNNGVHSNIKGALLYSAIKDDLGSAKEASMFLKRAGIEGIRYPVNHLSGGNTDGKSNYVVFDENAVEISEKILFQLNEEEKSSIISDEELEEIGFAYGSKEKYQEAIQEALRPLYSVSDTQTRRRTINTGNGKLREGNTTVPPQLKDIKRINIVGKTVTSPQEAAALFSFFRNPRTEIFNILYTSKTGEVLGHTAWTSGLPSIASTIDKENYKLAMDKIANVKSSLGADKIWIAHNHPSGNHTPSKEDISVTNSYEAKFQTDFAGHIVLDHDKFSFIDYNGVKEFPLEKPVKDFVIKSRKEATTITEPETIANTFKDVLTQNNTTVIAVVDTKHKIIAWTYITNKEALEVDTLDKYKKVLSRWGGTSAFILTNNNDTHHHFSNLSTKSARGVNDILLDVVLVDGKTGTYKDSGGSHQSGWQSQQSALDRSSGNYVKMLIERKSEQKVLFQKYKAAVEFLDDGRAVIRATKAADFSSFLHELGHILRRQIDSKDLAVLEEWLGVEGGEWHREHEEEFAEAIEQYFESGRAPNAKLQNVFFKIKEWLKSIYTRFDKKDLPDEVVNVFDNLFRTEKEKNIASELRIVEGEYLETLLNTRKLLDEYNSYIGPEIDEMEKKGKTTEKVIKKLESELQKIESLKNELQGDLSGIQSLDDFWLKWQKEVEEEEWYQKKLKLETYFSDLIPTKWEDLELLINQWKGDTFTRKGKGSGNLDVLLPMWRSAILNKGEYTEFHKKWLMTHVKNHPEYFVENYMAFTPGIGEEEYQDYEAWQELKKREKEEEALAKEKAEREAYLAKQEKEEELRQRLSSIATMRDRLELAGEFKDPLVKLRILTGEYTIGEILSGEDENSLGYYYEAGNKIPGTIKKALSEGKQEGVKQERVRKQGLEKTQREKKNTRAYIEKLARRISRKPSSTIDFYYKEAIRAIQEGIDPHFRAQKTLDRKEKFTGFLEKYPEKSAEIPVKVKTAMSKKSLNDLSIEELEAMDLAIETLRKQGRLKRKLKLAQEKREFENHKEQIVSTILKNKPIQEIRAKGKATRRKSNRAHLAMKERVWILRPQRMFDLLDGGKDFKGVIFDYFYNRANKIIDAELIKIDERREKGQQKAKKLGLNINRLGKVIRIDGAAYSKDEIIDIYAGFKNPLKREAILDGNNLTEELADKFISTLSDNEKAWGDYLIQDYEDNYDRLRTAHIEYTNEDLGKEENYTPIQRLDADYDGVEINLSQQLLERQNMKKAYAERGFTKNRIKIGKSHHKEIRLGITAMWMAQVQQQEHYIAGGQAIKEMQKMASNTDFTDSIRQKYGSSTVKAVRSFVNRVANPDIYKSTDDLSNVSKMLRQNTAVAYLAFNFVTMTKQVPSVIFYLPDAGIAHLTKSAIQFLNPVEMIKMINRAESLDPQIKHRSLNRFAEELKQADRSAYDKIIKKVGQAGMVGIYAFDKIAVTIGWNAVYEKSLARGMSETEAAQEAQNVTLRTQPAGHAKDLAQLYTQHEVLNWMLMFTNQLNQIYGMVTYDAPMRLNLSWQEKDFSEIYKAALTIGGVGLSSMMIWAIVHKRLPEDEEDVKDALTDSALGMLPVIGKDLAAANRGYYTNNDISVVKGIKGAMKGDAKKIIEGAAVTTGLPYIAGKRTYKAIEEQDFWELLGGAP